MKRILVRNTRMQATTIGVGIPAVGNFGLRQTIDIIAGDYNPRNLFLQRIALPCQLGTLYDPSSGGRIFSQLINGGDNDFRINERVSYGLRSGAGFTVRYAASIYEAGGFTGLVSNSSATAQFRVLYETVP
jgi:hypothetical protein